MHYYDIKDKDYFTGTRIDLIQLLPNNPEQKVLEIGAGGGDTITYIKKNNLAKEVMGLELFEIPNSNQSNPAIDKFVLGNIEQMDVPAEENYFDVIICGDVLEHLIDPWAVVEKLTKYLKVGGVMIASLPNVREMNTLIKIAVLGDFRYKEEGGVLDKTHLRFFCKKNIIDLLTTAKLKPVYNCPSFKYNPSQKSRKIMNMLTLGLFQNFLTFQHLVISKKTAN